MGAQQILRAASAAVVALAIAQPAEARTHERIAVIDLADDAAVRQKLASQIVAAGLDPVLGDGVEDALAGQNVDRDAVQLAAAIDEAKRMFGELKCKEATASAMTAIGLGSARQAAGLAVPELARAWSYVLLCADRAGDNDTAIAAASRLRELGGSTDVDASMLARYPEVDVLAGRDMVDIDVKTDVDGAEIWVDSRRAGVSPAHLILPVGPHVIAAAHGTKRGFVTGTVVKRQPVVTIPLTEAAGPWSKLAARIASWHGKPPSPAELAWVLDEVKARVALVRHGDVVEAWGRVGRSEPPHLLSGDDGKGNLGDAERVIALVADRVRGWNDRAPDPDQPLLVEAPGERFTRTGKDTTKKEEPTAWWVYASIAGAIAAGVIVIYAHDSAHDTQRVELHYP
ncbi:MAG: hypothetical protein JWO36_4314 [Myxococcales bacterium]|nr:hypothetical protein [Myxococcales bacterium]